MRKEIEKLGEVIKSHTNYADKLVFTFLGYYSLYIIQSTLSKDGVKLNEMHKVLEKNDTDKNYQIPNVLEFISQIESTFKIYQNFYGSNLADRIEYNWRNFGFNAIEEEFRTNPSGLQKVIDEFNELKQLTIEDLIDLAEYLNVSNRKLNNFFTPKNLSKLASSIISTSNHSVLATKNAINIYDPTCGIGRMLYHYYLDTRELYPNKIINIFGIDIYERFGIFTSSILNLVNRETYVVVGDTLTIEPNFPKMDIIIGNPPFDKINDTTYKNLLLLREYFNRNNLSRNENDYKQALKDMKKYKLKPINQTKYLEILNDYKII